MKNIRERLLFTCIKACQIYMYTFIPVATTIKRTQFSQMTDAHAAKLSDYSYQITKSSNWTTAIGYPRDRATNRRAENQSRASILVKGISSFRAFEKYTCME